MIQHNNMVESTCAWNRHGGPAQFVVTASNGDNWSVCTRHIAPMLTWQTEVTQAAYAPDVPDVARPPFTVEPISSNFGQRGPSVVDRMEDRARTKMHRDGPSVQGHADRIADELVDGSYVLDDSAIYAVEHLTAVRYTIGVGGPGEDVTFLLDSEGDVDYAIVDVQAAIGRAFVVLADPTVETLHPKFIMAGASE